MPEQTTEAPAETTAAQEEPEATTEAVTEAPAVEAETTTQAAGGYEIASETTQVGINALSMLPGQSSGNGQKISAESS